MQRNSEYARRSKLCALQAAHKGHQFERIDLGLLMKLNVGDAGAPVDRLHATALRQALESRKLQKSGHFFGNRSVAVA